MVERVALAVAAATPLVKLVVLEREVRATTVGTLVPGLGRTMLVVAVVATALRDRMPRH
jgi:hypothetical protein